MRLYERSSGNVLHHVIVADNVREGVSLILHYFCRGFSALRSSDRFNLPRSLCIGGSTSIAAPGEIPSSRYRRPSIDSFAISSRSAFQRRIHSNRHPHPLCAATCDKDRFCVSSVGFQVVAELLGLAFHSFPYRKRWQASKKLTFPPLKPPCPTSSRLCTKRTKSSCNRRRVLRNGGPAILICVSEEH